MGEGFDLLGVFLGNGRTNEFALIHEGLNQLVDNHLFFRMKICHLTTQKGVQMPQRFFEKTNSQIHHILRQKTLHSPYLNIIF